MNDFYVLQDVIDIIQRKCQDAETRKQIEDVLEYRHVSKSDFRNIMYGNVPYNQVSKELVILIYDALSNVIEVNPKSDYFEDIEIENADAYGKLHGAKEIYRILTNKGIKINLERKVAFLIDEYIVQYCDKKTTKDIINKFAQMAQIEGKFGKDLSDFGSEEYDDLFSNYSANAFNVYKNIVTKYVQWSYRNGYTSEDRLVTIQELMPGDINNHALYLEQYFASSKQILNLLEIIDRESSNAEPISEHVWDNVIYPTLVLSWIGFEIDEIVQLKVSDVDVNGNEVFSSATDKRISNIKPELMAIIDNTQHAAIMNASEYLIFTDSRVSTNQPFSVNLIAQKITGLNKRAVESNITKKFGTKKVRLSGNYSRMFEYEKESGRDLNASDINIVSMLCRQEIDRTRISIILKDFDKWKQALSIERD